MRRSGSGSGVSSLARWLLATTLVTAVGCSDPVRVGSQFRILVTPNDLVLQRFDSAQVNAAVVDMEGDTVGRAITFQPQDPTLVSVSSGGMVRSQGPVGNTIVLLHDAIDQVYDTLYVSVGTTLVRISLGPADTAIRLEGRIAYRVTGYDAYGPTSQPFSLSFHPDSGYLSDSGGGIVHANGRPGEVVVTVQSGSVSAQAGVLIGDTLTAGRLPAPGHPRWVAMSQNGRGFVSRSAAQFVTQYDAAARTPGPSLIVPFGVSALALDSAGGRLYAVTSTSVLDIDLAADSTVHTYFTGAQPLGVAVGPDGLTLWVSVVGDVLLVYDRVTGGLMKTLSATTMTRFVADPAGDSLLYGMTSGAVVEINTRTDSVARTFGGGGSLTDLAVSADGGTVFTADAGKQRVTVWSLTTGVVTDSIPLAAAPQGLALAADGTQLWVTVPSLGEALVYDPQTRVLAKTVTLHGHPEGVGVGPSGKVALVANDSGWVDVVPR